MSAVHPEPGLPFTAGLRAFDGQITRSRLVAFLVGFVVLIRIAHVALIAQTPLVEFHREFVDTDMWFFDQWAQKIVAGDWLGRETFHPLAGWQLNAAPQARWDEWYGTDPSFYKAPFYAYFLAVMKLLRAPVAVTFALQAIIAGASGWLLFRVTDRVFGSAAALGALGLFAVYAPDIHFGAVMLRGPFVVFSSLLVTERLLATALRPTAGNGIAAGAAIGFSLVVNESMAPVLILAPLSLLLAGLPLKRMGLFSISMMVGALVALSPVIVRNLIVGVPPLRLAVTGSVVLAVFNSATSDPFFFSASPENFAPVMQMSGANVVDTLMACARTFTSPAEFLLFYARKVAGLVAPFENPDNANFYYAAVVNPWLAWLPAYGVLLPLVMVGAVLAWRNRSSLWWTLLPASLCLLAGILVTMPLSRYRAGWAVHLMPLAGVALSSIWSWARQREGAKVLYAVLGIAACYGGQVLIEHEVIFPRREPGTIIYRPQEFVLAGRMEAAAGRFALAAHELEMLAVLNPDMSVKRQALELADEYRAHLSPPGGVPNGR